jgi:hypothetical protein
MHLQRLVISCPLPALASCALQLGCLNPHRCPGWQDARHTCMCMQMAAASRVKVDSMTNIATVAFKERDFSECFKWCDKALRWSPHLLLLRSESLCMPSYMHKPAHYPPQTWRDASLRYCSFWS